MKTIFKRKAPYLYDKVRNNYYKYMLSDKDFIKKYFKKQNSREVNLTNPVEFTDKLQWLKLNWYDPVATQCADKFEVREYITKRVGAEYLNELYGVYESLEDIKIEELPKSFVLKATHSSGQNIVCEDKTLVDWELSFKKMRNWLKTNYFWSTREWVYKGIKPRIICEQYLTDEENLHGLTDYKIYCFNGKPTYCQVIKERGSNGSIDFFDTQWNHMEFTGLQNMPRSIEEIKKPEKYDEMLRVSQELSKSFPFVRVDFYYVNNKIYFGELTFFPGSGFGTFDPPVWNERMGNLLKLPPLKNK